MQARRHPNQPFRLGSFTCQRTVGPQMVACPSEPYCHAQIHRDMQQTLMAGPINGARIVSAARGSNNVASLNFEKIG
jgi:hypothetical protein